MWKVEHPRNWLDFWAVAAAVPCGHSVTAAGVADGRFAFPSRGLFPLLQQKQSYNYNADEKEQSCQAPANGYDTVSRVPACDFQNWPVMRRAGWDHVFLDDDSSVRTVKCNMLNICAPVFICSNVLHEDRGVRVGSSAAFKGCAADSSFSRGQHVVVVKTSFAIVPVCIFLRSDRVNSVNVPFSASCHLKKQQQLNT